MKDEHEKIKKQSYISLFFSYCIYFYDIRLMHLLIDEITQLGIITVYIWKNNNNGKNTNERKKKIAYSSGFACPPWNGT